MLVFILFFTEENLVFFLCCCLPKFFHLISQSPRMFHLYLSISCVSSWSFSAALSVLVFHVLKVQLSLPRIFDGAPVAYLTPPSCVRRKARSLLTRAATYPVFYGCLFSSYGESRARYNLTEPIPPQVEHLAVEFFVEPFRQSCLCLRTMKISAQ